MTTLCPAHGQECGEQVSVDMGSFSSTTITVEACERLKAVAVRSYEIRKSALFVTVGEDS